LAGCPKTQAPEAPAEAAAGTRAMPGPLAERAFVLPTAQEGTLSNGLRVFVVPNDEVGLFDARLFLRTGIAHDPVGKEGLGSLAFEMITHGAAGRTAVEQAQLLKPLGGEV